MRDVDGEIRVLALPPAVTRRSLSTLEDVREYVDPAGTWVLGPDREPRAVARARQVFDEPVVHPPLGDAGPVQRHDLGDVSIVTVQNGPVLDSASDESRALETILGALDDGRSVALVCDDVTTTVRPTALETDLEYASELAGLASAVAGEADSIGDRPATTLTLLTGSLPASYDETWHLEPSSGRCLGVSPGDEADRDRLRSDDSVAIRVHGTGSVDGYGDARSIARLRIRPGRSSGGDGTDGRELAIDADSLAADSFGLEAVTGVGPKTADRLESRGIESREALLETPVATLAELPGVGSASAERMRVHAEVLETSEPRRLTDESLPGEYDDDPPLCLDIETDGLSPTIIWQIGVYDPAADEHRAFVERTDPSDPGRVLQSVCDWLLGTHPDRALVTWNGWRFDYRHLGAFVNRHVPYYAEEWASIPKFDLYHWTVTEENALLPGRTNKLEAVARALGYEGSETGLDGAATAAAYQRFVRTGTELEWDRHEAYCEDDCRALWHVYERVREAPVATSRSRLDDGDRRREDDSSEQVGLDAF